MKKMLLTFLPVIFVGAAHAGEPMFDAKTQNVYLCDSLKYQYSTTETTDSYSYSYSSTTSYSYNYRCYRSGYWFWSRYSCGGSYGYSSTSTYSYSQSSSTTTTQHVEDNNSGMDDGFQVMTSDFPYAAVCDRDVYTAAWREVYALCPGLNMAYRDSSKTVDAVSDTAYCWGWKCKPGYAMLAAGECVSQSECTGRGLKWTGSTCEGFNFCNGWSQYNQAAHNPLLVSGCYQYRCKEMASGQGFNSASDHKCSYASNAYTTGGKWLNTSTGVLSQCTAQQYNKSQTGTSDQCAAIATVAKDRFDACWGCKSQPKLIECLRSSQTPSATVLPDCYIPAGS